MKHTIVFKRALLASAIAAFMFCPASTKAAPAPTATGTCVGSDVTGGAGADCVTALGHASASIVGTLSINEFRAINFGNMAILSAGAGDANLALDLDGTRTLSGAQTDVVTLLYGADNGGFVGGAGAPDSGGQSPGHYTVSGANEGNAANTQVYISFQDGAGNGIDMCNSTGGQCDNYFPGNQIALVNGAESLFMDHFVINEAGNDVFGHYVDNSNPLAAASPGSTTPGNPGGGQFTAASAGVTDVVVGATLHTDPAHAAGAYGVGRYRGTFNIMVSY